MPRGSKQRQGDVVNSTEAGAEGVDRGNKKILNVNGPFYHFVSCRVKEVNSSVSCSLQKIADNRRSFLEASVRGQAGVRVAGAKGEDGNVEQGYAQKEEEQQKKILVGRVVVFTCFTYTVFLNH